MSGKNWVLLLAGSKGWKNYQHQANVCGLYQIIKRHMIPEDQIVVMMYDDIAYNKQNPYKGTILSGITDLQNVYPRVPKDYTGADVTPQNFLAALQGDDRTAKKIIRSNHHDRIFVYMSGLGGKRIFGFPEASLRASDLIGTINYMYYQKHFSKMVFYMDADNSDTMFRDLSEAKNVYAVTSCDESKANVPINYHRSRSVYISDEFSTALLHFLHANDFTSAKLTDLFQYFVRNVSTNPQEFGDQKLSGCKFGDFLKE